MAVTGSTRSQERTRLTAADLREPAAGQAGPARREASTLRHRLRMVAACLLLAAIAFNSAPGMLIPETKLDLAIDPAGFLSRALHL